MYTGAHREDHWIIPMYALKNQYSFFISNLLELKNIDSLMKQKRQPDEQ